MRPMEILGLNEDSEEEIVLSSHSVYDSCHHRSSNMQYVDTQKGGLSFTEALTVSLCSAFKKGQFLRVINVFLFQKNLQIIIIIVHFCFY